MEDVKEVSDEFTKRIAESEKKLQAALREKEILKKTLQDLEIGKRCVISGEMCATSCF